MTDMERINMMADASWKPASTYWKEQFDKVSAELQAERELSDALALDLDGSWQYAQDPESLVAYNERRKK